MVEMAGQRFEKKPRLRLTKASKRRGLTSPKRIPQRDGTFKDRVGVEGWQTTKSGIGDVQLELGDFGGLVLRDDGSVWGWGYHGVGAFSNMGTSVEDPEYTYNWIPYHVMPVSFMTGVAKIAAGSANFYAVKDEGTLWHWGEDDWNASNLSDLENNGPQRVGPHDDIVDVCHVGGGIEGCLYRREDGSIWGAGDAQLSAYGIPPEDYDLFGGSWPHLGLNPIEVTQYFPENIVSWQGASDEAAAGLVTSSGDVWVWDDIFSLIGGDYDPGNCGPEFVFGVNARMTQVQNVSDAVEIRMGGHHVAAVRTATGQLKIWGLADRAILADTPTAFECDAVVLDERERTIYVQYPTAVPGFSNVEDFDVHWSGGIARLPSDEVWGWGYNNYGALGYDIFDPEVYNPEGSETDARLPETIFDAQNTAGPVRMSGFSFTCAIDSNCVPWLMGYNGSVFMPDEWDTNLGNPNFDLYEVYDPVAGGFADTYSYQPIPACIVTGEA